MKNKQLIDKWIKSILVCLGIYFLISCYYLYNHVLLLTTKQPLRNMTYYLISQNIIIALVLLTGFICWKTIKQKKTQVSSIQSLTIISKSGTLQMERTLDNIHSLFIAKKGKNEIVIDHTQKNELDSYEYAVLNFVSGHWYIEVLSGKYPVGLKKENDSVIYKLKLGMPYKLNVNDIIYIDSNKILLR